MRRLALAALALALGGRAAAEPLDEALYARILARYTRAVTDAARTRVDYAALTRAPEWSRLIESVSRSEPAALAPREQRLAYWIDVYNILAIDVVVRHYPVASIRDAGSWLRPVWKQEAGRIGGRPISLDEIEHRILRPLGDPRVHAAIVCASVSCPRLAREPYTAARVDAQLDEAVRLWLADPDKGLRLDADGGGVHLSRIFDWFRGDFAAGGGVLAFAAAFAPPEAAAWIARQGEGAKVRWLPYDWSLNDLAGAATSDSSHSPPPASAERAQRGAAERRSPKSG
jgi:hypothetical protein